MTGARNAADFCRQHAGDGTQRRPRTCQRTAFVRLKFRVRDDDGGPATRKGGAMMYSKSIDEEGDFVQLWYGARRTEMGRK